MMIMQELFKQLREREYRRKRRNPLSLSFCLFVTSNVKKTPISSIDYIFHLFFRLFF